MFDWVRNLFNPNLETLHILLKRKEELAELVNDRTVQIKFNELGLGEFWIYTKKRISKFNKIGTFRVATHFQRHSCAR
jgi:hypothetical protein